jgi:hypothetical protein
MNPEQFALVPGVGQAKLARYADAFIAAIRDHQSARPTENASV